MRGAASIGNGSAGFDLAYDPAGRIGSTTLTATASRVPMDDLGALLGFDLGLKDAVGDIDLKLRGGGRSAAAALNGASGTVEFAVGKGFWPADGLAGWPDETLRLLGTTDAGASFNCLAGRFEVSAGVANLRRLVFDTQRATWIGGGYLSLRNEGWEFIVAPEARDAQGVPLATPLQIEGRHRPRGYRRARARAQQAADRCGDRAEPDRHLRPDRQAAERQCLRDHGAAGRRHAAGPARPAPGADHAIPIAPTAARRAPQRSASESPFAGPSTACKAFRQ